MAALIEWAHRAVTGVQYHYCRVFGFMGLDHWSRQYEYPWVLDHGAFGHGQLVLDAGGGNACCLLQYALSDRNCFVVNMDIDKDQLAKNDIRVLYTVGDIQNIPYLDDSFYKVICVSVLEHLPDPQKALLELFRVLKPGGRLLVTMDVADTPLTSSVPDLQHGITREVAEGIVKQIGLELPPEPDDIMVHTISGTEVKIKVLCFYVDKAKIG